MRIPYAGHIVGRQKSRFSSKEFFSIELTMSARLGNDANMLGVEMPVYEVLKDGALQESVRHNELLPGLHQGRFAPNDLYRKKGKEQWHTLASLWKREQYVAMGAGFLSALLLIPFGIYALCLGSWFVQQARESSLWPSAPGTITSAVVQDANDSQYRPDIHYRYQAKGRWHQNSLVSFDLGPGTQTWAQATVDRYPAGSTCRIYYDPIRPGYSVLEPGLNPRSLEILLIAWMAVYIGTATGWFAIRIPFQRMTEPESRRSTWKGLLFRFLIVTSPVILCLLLLEWEIWTR